MRHHRHLRGHYPSRQRYIEAGFIDNLLDTGKNIGRLIRDGKREVGNLLMKEFSKNKTKIERALASSLDVKVRSVYGGGVGDYIEIEDLRGRDINLVRLNTADVTKSVFSITYSYEHYRGEDDKEVTLSWLMSNNEASKSEDIKSWVDAHRDIFNALNGKQTASKDTVSRVKSALKRSGKSGKVLLFILGKLGVLSVMGGIILAVLTVMTPLVAVPILVGLIYEGLGRLANLLGFDVETPSGYTRRKKARLEHKTDNLVRIARVLHEVEMRQFEDDLYGY